MNTSARTSSLSLGALTLAGAIGFAAVATASAPTSARMSDDPPPTETMVLAFPFEGGHLRFVDTGKKGIGPGDLFLGTGLPVLDNATGQRIGTSDAVELIVSARHDGTVTSQSTLRLPGGHIDLDGVVRHTDDPFRVTVTGGTGRYSGVGGQLTLLREDVQRKVSVMRLELVR
jgi:hypothetical protein